MTIVVRSRSIRSMILSTSNDSSQNRHAPECIEDIRLLLKPPTQKNGMGVYE